MSKEKFKEFARNNPKLSRLVIDGKTTWQKLYELYDIYGENSSIWDKYLKNDVNKNDLSFSNILDKLKNMDKDELQKNIGNISKDIGLLEGLTAGEEVKQYEARPLYKYFED